MNQTPEHFDNPNELAGCTAALLVLAISALLWAGVIGGAVLVICQWLF